MAGVRCIRKPAAPGKPRPTQPPCNRRDRCRTAAGSNAPNLPEASQCPAPSGSTPAGCRAPARKKTPPPRFYAARSPMKKKRAVRPRKNGLHKSAVSHERKIAGHRIHSSKNRRSEGLKMLSAGKSAKNKEKYRAKNTQRPESSPTGVFRPALPHDKKIPLPDRQRDPY